jgi:hypothetical protein
LLPLYNTEEVGNWRRKKNWQQARFDFRVPCHPRQGNLLCGMSVNREVKNGQPGSLLGLRIYPQKDLVRKLVPSGCSRLPKGNIQDISFRVIGDTDGPHRFSPPSPTNLISGHNEVVLSTVRIKAKANHNDNSGVVVRETTIVPIVKVHLRPDRILEPMPSTDRLQDLPFVPLHFRMFLTDMVPAFIRQINLMAQLIFNRPAHQAGSAYNILVKGSTGPLPLIPSRQGGERFSIL